MANVVGQWNNTKTDRNERLRGMTEAERKLCCPGGWGFVVWGIDWGFLCVELAIGSEPLGWIVAAYCSSWAFEGRVESGNWIEEWNLWKNGLVLKLLVNQWGNEATREAGSGDWSLTNQTSVSCTHSILELYLGRQGYQLDNVAHINSFPYSASHQIIRASRIGCVNRGWLPLAKQRRWGERNWRLT